MYLFGKRKTGLALGGGAALGACNIGVLRTLEEHNVQVDCISETSIGALIGAFYAFGMKPEAIKEVAVNLQRMDISNLSLSRLGLLSNKKAWQNHGKESWPGKYRGRGPGTEHNRHESV